MQDMPTLESPFVRDGKNYLVTPQINPGYEWVFEDPEVICTEKIDGTCVSIFMQDGKLLYLFNRTDPHPVDNLISTPLLEGVRVCFMKGRLPMQNGQHFGEVVGPYIGSNLLKMDRPQWFPFEYLRRKYSYNSFHKYPKTFENLSSWLQEGIHSLMYAHYQEGKVPPEGVVFYQPSTGKMAKLRRDMFDWYKGQKHT